MFRAQVLKDLFYYLRLYLGAQMHSLFFYHSKDKIINYDQTRQSFSRPNYIISNNYLNQQHAYSKKAIQQFWINIYLTPILQRTLTRLFINTFYTMDQSSFDLLITSEEYRSLESKLNQKDKEIRELRDIVIEKEAVMIDVIDRLNKSQEMVRKLSYDALKISKKYIYDDEEKQKSIDSLKKELVNREVKIKQYFDIQNKQKEDLLLIKSKLDESQALLKQKLQQKQQNILQITLQYKKSSQLLNKLRISQRLRINEQKQQLIEIVTDFLSKIQTECKNLSQHIAQANKLYNQLSAELQLVEKLSQSKQNYEDQSNIPIFQNIFSDIKQKSPLLQAKLRFIEGKVKGILVQIQKLKDKL